MEMIMTSVNMKETGKRIRELRLEHNIKVLDIMEALGLESEQAIYKWQRGDSIPTVDNLLRLAELFDCHMEDIIVADYGNVQGESSIVSLYKEAPYGSERELCA